MVCKYEHGECTDTMSNEGLSLYAFLYNNNNNNTDDDDDDDYENKQIIESVGRWLLVR